MELRQLEYFTTLSRLKNFTRTAEILGVSQPSVTKAVKALETELGVKLIDRQHRNL
ncbi:MAG: LysR family transcriptional regulator, partial [Schwartzia sp.]|nr:LysR family transcriptional regulator [Schwartzia sp. (in: firmicutes)]